MTWEEALAHALASPGTEQAAWYGRPAVKANGHAILSLGHESTSSFVLHLEAGLIDMLMASHPDTFWQTTHYSGYAAVLVRHDSPHDALVREMIDRARAHALVKRRRR